MRVYDGLCTPLAPIPMRTRAITVPGTLEQIIATCNLTYIFKEQKSCNSNKIIIYNIYTVRNISRIASY